MSTPRHGHAAVTGSDGRIYAIGGTAGPNIYNTVERYDPSNNTWATVAPVPTARWGLAAATGGDGCIYAIGGITGPPGTILNVVEAYDPGSNSWTTVAPMPTRRLYLDFGVEVSWGMGRCSGEADRR